MEWLVIRLSQYFHIIGNMNNEDAILAFLALGQESRLNIFRLIVQRGDRGLTPGELIEKLGIPLRHLKSQRGSANEYAYDIAFSEEVTRKRHSLMFHTYSRHHKMKFTAERSKILYPLS